MLSDLLFILAGALETNSCEPADLQLHVHLYDYGALSPITLDYAKAEASRLLGPAVPIAWQTCQVNPEQSCGHEFQPGDIILRVISHGNAPPQTVAMAYVADPGEYAVILYDRIRAFQGYNKPAYSILGKVMAHEITHLLLGAGSHTPTGMMRRTWSTEELGIGSMNWFYTPEQKAAMHAQVVRRATLACDFAATR